ncbi:hypothetical protein V8E36_004378 [Tilletia maclaganii]
MLSWLLTSETHLPLCSSSRHFGTTLHSWATLPTTASQMMIAMLNDIAIASTSGPAPVTPARPGHFHCLDTPRTEELPRATVSVQIAELLAEIEPQAAASPQQVEDDGPRIPVRRRPRKVVRNPSPTRWEFITVPEFSPIPMSSNNAVVTPEADRLGPADSPRRTERVRAAAKMDAPLRSILNQIGSGSPRRNVARRSGLGKGKVKFEHKLMVPQQTYGLPRCRRSCCCCRPGTWFLAPWRSDSVPRRDSPGAGRESLRQAPTLEQSAQEQRLHLRR